MTKLFKVLIRSDLRLVNLLHDCVSRFLSFAARLDMLADASIRLPVREYEGVQRRVRVEKFLLAVRECDNYRVRSRAAFAKWLVRIGSRSRTTPPERKY